MRQGKRPAERICGAAAAQLTRRAAALIAPAFSQESPSTAESIFADVADDPYLRLLNETALPPVRSAVANAWDPHNPEPLLAFFERWDAALPPTARSQLLVRRRAFSRLTPHSKSRRVASLHPSYPACGSVGLSCTDVRRRVRLPQDHSVMPKLQAAVEAWDPRTCTVAIHLWMHPWLPILGVRALSSQRCALPLTRKPIFNVMQCRAPQPDGATPPTPNFSALLQPRLEPFFAPIRFKLGHALSAWHPSDGSALALLSPWQRVFSPSDWDALLVRCIAPKLAFALQELSVNPAAQVLDPLLWVIAWADAMPARHLAALLESGFFPKWLSVLHQWLSARPDYDEVTRWFLGWKGQFPETLLAHEKVRKGFNTALDLMNQARCAPPLNPMQRECDASRGPRAAPSPRVCFQIYSSAGSAEGFLSALPLLPAQALAGTMGPLPTAAAPLPPTAPAPEAPPPPPEEDHRCAEGLPRPASLLTHLHVERGRTPVSIFRVRDLTNAHATTSRTFRDAAWGSRSGSSWSGSRRTTTCCSCPRPAASSAGSRCESRLSGGPAKNGMAPSRCRPLKRSASLTADRGVRGVRLQVYSFGKASIIVDNSREEIFAQEGGKWVRGRAQKRVNRQEQIAPARQPAADLACAVEPRRSSRALTAHVFASGSYLCRSALLQVPVSMSQLLERNGKR